jgi:hypothetical protein
LQVRRRMVGLRADLIALAVCLQSVAKRRAPNGRVLERER